MISICLIKEWHLCIHIMFLTGVGIAPVSKVCNGLKIGSNLDKEAAFKFQHQLLVAFKF